MATITLSVPDDVRNKMKTYDQVNWSSVARTAVIEHIAALERKEKLRTLLAIEDKELAWTVALGKKAKEGRAKQLQAKGLLA